MKRVHAAHPDLSTPEVHSFFIYGFEEQHFDGRFLHFERIEEQLAFHDWDAKPHLHKGLHQLMCLETGHGQVLLEDTWHDFKAPFMLFVPQGIVHGFHFSRDTAGPILTVSAQFMQEVIAFSEPEVMAAIEQPHRISLSPDLTEILGVQSVLEGFERDYRWGGPGRTTALIARLALLLVIIARSSARTAAVGAVPAGYPDLYDNFRHHLEGVFRRQPTVSDMASALSLTVGRLTAICRTVSGYSPQELLHQRILVEAKRQLLYSSRSSISIAYLLGFKDPAYFSRFFKRMTGQSPVAFRRDSSERAVASWGDSGKSPAPQPRQTAP